MSCRVETTEQDTERKDTEMMNLKKNRNMTHSTKVAIDRTSRAVVALTQKLQDNGMTDEVVDPAHHFVGILCDEALCSVNELNKAKAGFVSLMNDILKMATSVSPGQETTNWRMGQIERMCEAAGADASCSNVDNTIPKWETCPSCGQDFRPKQLNQIYCRVACELNV